MTRKKMTPRPIRISSHLTEEEYQVLLEKFRATTCRSLPQFFRAKVFEQPITIRTRNQSVDEFLEVAIGLKNQLTAIRQSLDHAVLRLRLLQDRNGLKSAIEAIELALFAEQQKSSEIRSVMNKIYQQWLQK